MNDTAPPLLHGVAAIAAHLNCEPRRIYRLLERSVAKDARLPLWKFGDRWCADPRDLDAWRDLQRRKAGAMLPPEK